jgi:hypothetical protein
MPAMRMLKLALVLVAAAACGPRGYYVANVYSVNGGLVQEKCEITMNGRANPDECHVEPVAQMQQQMQPQGYPQQQPYAQPVAPAQPPAVPAQPPSY